MTQAETTLSRIGAEYQQSVLTACAGHELEFLIELVRALDETAYAFYVATNRDELRANDGYRQAMLLGIGSALLPFIAKTEGLDCGVPWSPTDDNALFADHYLYSCGGLAHVIRLASLERYGLATTRFVSEQELYIEVASADPEAYDVRALKALRARAVRRHHDSRSNSDRKQPSDLKQRLARYVDRDPIYFIRYDNDLELVTYYRQLAASHGSVCLEREALPDHSPIGSKTFGEWCAAATGAHGRVLQHIAFATMLKSQHPGVNFRDVFTVFVRRDDARAVLEELGESAADEFIAAGTLDSLQAERYARDTETPAPLYIPLGKNFLLLPCFGALMNPFVGITRHLRTAYKADWDRAVEGREALFRDELRELLPASRYSVSSRSCVLRRPDGSKLTDIDAVVHDRQTEMVGLFQLKWHDIYGRSLRERHSRRLNLLEANDWVERVSMWLQTHTRHSIEHALDLLGSSNSTGPKLFVVSRYASRFSQDGPRDQRATWLGWADVLGVASTEGADVLEELLALKSLDPRRDQPLSTEPERFVFPGLSVQVVVNPDFRPASRP